MRLVSFFAGMAVAIGLVSIGLWAVILAPKTPRACDAIGLIVPARNTEVLCTKAVEFAGICGKPNIPKLPGYEDVAVYLNPWEEQNITLREVQVIAVLTSAPIKGQPPPGELNIGVFSGNSYNMDPMTPYKYGYSLGAPVVVVEAHNRFPAGTGMQFPGRKTDSGRGPAATRLDVHVDCGPAGSPYVGRWFLSYTINWPRDEFDRWHIWPKLRSIF